MTSDPGERAAQREVARKIALDLLTARQRSKEELRRAMAKRNVPSDVADEIVDRFEQVGLVDDAAFAQALTQSRGTYSGRGRARIRQELQAKGIDRDIVEEALGELDPAQEREAALRLAQKRARSMAGLEPHVARRRLMGVLARRGYAGSIVASVVDETLGTDHDFG